MNINSVMKPYNYSLLLVLVYTAYCIPYTVYRIDNNGFIILPSLLSGKLLAKRMNEKLWNLFSLPSR